MFGRPSSGGKGKGRDGRATSTGSADDVSSTSRDMTGTNGPGSRCTVRSLWFSVGRTELSTTSKPRAARHMPALACHARHRAGRYVLTDDSLGNALKKNVRGVQGRVWTARNSGPATH